MNKGVELIIARMESNPDEFVRPNEYSLPPSKWASIMESVRKRTQAIMGEPDHPNDGKYLAYLPDDEILAIWTKYQSLKADQFTNSVMQILLKGDDAVGEAEDGNYHTSAQAASGTQKIKLSQEQIKAYAEAQQKAMEAQYKALIANNIK